MSDYSSFALFTAGLAVFAPLVSAETIKVPGGSMPTGPAIFQPNLNVLVTAGTPFSITWQTGTQDSCGKTVDLVLLKGPSSSSMEAIAYIKQGVENSGNYAWTPSADLEPSPTDYGIELVCSKDNSYQYTPRFGISNDKFKSGGSYGGGGGDHNNTNSTVPTTPQTNNTTPDDSPKPKYPIGSSSGNGTDSSPPSASPSGSNNSIPSPPPPSSPGSGNAPGTTPRPSNGAGAIRAGVSGLLAAAVIAAIAL